MMWPLVNFGHVIETQKHFRSAFAANYFLLVGIIPPDLYGGYIRVMSLRVLSVL